MGKQIYALFTILICLVDAATDKPNIYEIKKSSIKHPDSTSKSEHGKLSLFYIRAIVSFVLQILKAILKPAAHATELIIPECKGLDTNHSFFNGLVDDFKEKVQLIAPGTKWCGAGNVAYNETDLGISADTDKCCRSHDLCPQNIAAGEIKYGLKNSGLFTRSLCSCDEAFYNCLKNVTTTLAQDTGLTYFNVLGPQCFKLVNCSDPGVTCRNNQRDGTQYQWSDNPTF